MKISFVTRPINKNDLKEIHFIFNVHLKKREEGKKLKFYGQKCMK